jgi:hypothetical protein
MPQHLCFTVDARSVALLSTGNLSRQGLPTTYKITWTSAEANNEFIGRFDTGLPCQPASSAEAHEDLLCDFTHARRGIAAAQAAANAILDRWLESFRASGCDFKMIRIYLRTNCYDRGCVMVSEEDERALQVKLRIGTGPVRPIGANPRQPWSVCYRQSVSSDGLSPLGKALKLLSSENCRLSELLEAELIKTKT